MVQVQVASQSSWAGWPYMHGMVHGMVHAGQVLTLALSAADGAVRAVHVTMHCMQHAHVSLLQPCSMRSRGVACTAALHGGVHVHDALHGP